MFLWLRVGTQLVFSPVLTAGRVVLGRSAGFLSLGSAKCSFESPVLWLPVCPARRLASRIPNWLSRTATVNKGYGAPTRFLRYWHSGIWLRNGLWHLICVARLRVRYWISVLCTSSPLLDQRTLYFVSVTGSLELKRMERFWIHCNLYALYFGQAIEFLRTK